MKRNSIKILLGVLAFAAASTLTAPESAEAQGAQAGGWSSTVAVPLTGTTIAGVCAEAKKAARTNAALACAPKDVKIIGCNINSSGAGPAFPPPLFYYWCKVTCGYTCVAKPKPAADATSDTSSSSSLEEQLIEYFQRTQANAELESLLREAGEEGVLEIQTEELK